MTGGAPRSPASGGESLVPPASAIDATPVRPWYSRRALVSCLTGARTLTSIIA